MFIRVSNEFINKLLKSTLHVSLINNKLTRGKSQCEITGNIYLRSEKADAHTQHWLFETNQIIIICKLNPDRGRYQTNSFILITEPMQLYEPIKFY